jgi:hypothetical protein
MRGATVTDYRQLLACSDAELGQVDPLVMNLLVAKRIPGLADLDIARYRKLADQWADGVRRRLPGAERVFRRTPQDWKNDVNFFRLGVLCGYLEHVAWILRPDPKSGLQLSCFIKNQQS